MNTYRTPSRITLILFAVMLSSTISQSQSIFSKKKKAPDYENQGVGIVSDLHQNHQNQVIFSKIEIEQTSPESQLTNDFTMGEDIYFRVFSDGRSLMDVIHNKFDEKEYDGVVQEMMSRFKMHFILDGERLLETVILADVFEDEEKQTWSTFRGALKDGNRTGMIGVNQFNSFVKKFGESKLTPGSHELRIEIYANVQARIEGWEDELFAAGSITLTVGESGFADPNDPNVCMPLAKLSDETLQKELMDLVLEYTNEEGWTLQLFNKVIIPDKDWYIIRDELTGIVTGKGISAFIPAKWNDGKCTYRQYYFKKEYVGGEFLATYFDSFDPNPNKTIPCSCVKN